jgi:hypothetical protein
MTDTTTTNDTQPITHRGRRISWAEFYRQRPDLRPDTDAIPQLGAAARRQELSPNHRSSS